MAHLTTSITINNLALKNRLVLPPMASHKATPDGEVSKAMLSYYNEKSKGGYIPLIITEHSYVSVNGKAHDGQLSIAKDLDIDGLKKIAAVIHQNGSKAIIQISHAGSVTNQSVTTYPTIGVSKETTLEKYLPDIEMSTKNIKRVINDFQEASQRAMDSGFDGVEIHSAHGYLLNQFYSPLTNKRTDSYGGSIEKRIQIHLEIIRQVRNTIGKNKALLLRLGACDYIEGGSTIEDAIFAAKCFEKAGLDALDISGGLSGFMIKGKEDQEGYFQEETEAIKKHINIPIILTGGIVNGKTADLLITKGKADLIGVGRAMLKDSLWAKKALAELK